MTPDMRKALEQLRQDVMGQMVQDAWMSGIPIYCEKVKLPEWSEYDKGIMASCGIRP